MHSRHCKLNDTSDLHGIQFRFRFFLNIVKLRGYGGHVPMKVQKLINKIDILYPPPTRIFF